MNRALICGMLGCLCFGAGDWLMIYGDTAYTGGLYWLTAGVSNIPAWRNTLAMVLSFPGIIFYGIALFAMEKYITSHRHQKVYHYLTVFGLTPWIALHLFYIMILYLFAWMKVNEFAAAALPAAQALYEHLSWVVVASEAMMLPPFIYWFYLVVTGKSALSKKMAISNPLVIYLVLYLVKSFMPDSAFRIGFTNGLMSQSMIIWFAAFLFWNVQSARREVDGKA